MENQIDNILLKANKAGLEKAMLIAPEMDALELIEIAYNLAMGKKSGKEIIQELHKDYGPAVRAYIETFGDNAINTILKESGEEGLVNLSKGDFSKRLEKTVLSIGEIVVKYASGKLSNVEFLSALNKSGFADVSRDFLKGCGIGDEILMDPAGGLRALSSPVIGYAATVKAYEILMKALEDAGAAYEHRLAIEERCKKAIEMIQKYRKEMEEAVSKYFTRHHETIQSGFEVMDKALMENDTDGYIRGNAELQKLLGYESQFHNQKEFDDLMNSDIALKL